MIQPKIFFTFYKNLIRIILRLKFWTNTAEVAFCGKSNSGQKSSIKEILGFCDFCDLSSFRKSFISSLCMTSNYYQKWPWDVIFLGSRIWNPETFGIFSEFWTICDWSSVCSSSIFVCYIHYVSHMIDVWQFILVISGINHSRAICLVATKFGLKICLFFGSLTQPFDWLHDAPIQFFAIFR